jgi:lysophospholipase L1-like esterase
MNFATLPVALLLLAATGDSPTLTRTQTPAAALKPLPMRVVGRVEREPGDMLRRQWPGTYFETAFRGPAALFKVGPGEVSLRVSIDRAPARSLVKPAPGLYRLGGLGPGRHTLRVQIASESQAGPTDFGGFYAPPGVAPAPFARPSRQIEFIGDSLTVGYGNLSPTRQCSEADVWLTTDTTRGIAPLTAARFGADYQVNAISGRGIIRNYAGFRADPLPQAYPFLLFDKRTRAADPRWRPRFIVIALGANDFSTPPNATEKWKSDAELRADFEATYVRFVSGLRQHYPRARFVLWATEETGGKVLAEARKVAARLAAAGETRLDVVPITGLARTGCNSHPSLGDDAAIAAALARAIGRHPEAWGN